MSNESNAPAHPDPRLVPTLTEVVGRVEPVLEEAEHLLPASPAGAWHGPAAEADAAPAPPAPPAPAGAAAVPGPPLAEQVLDLLGDELERRIGEAIARALHEQMLGLSPRVRAVVAEEVRDAVAQALERGLSGPGDSRNP